ncbi:MAG: hypothetical protein A2X86_18670 [Bdellovibrionales bacterium GWA2_49_15]|nr:MAG: hypothetical protein A2X86_18670 [Bdellovibrionales bacterium GWA2_49_15]HAZ14251.1 hypothetical protein [Bdellovibrionales bacterium]
MDTHTLNLEELMTRPTKEQLKQLKVKCYVALLVSNLMMFTLMLPTENKASVKKISAASGNIVLRLPLTLMLSLNLKQKTHVTLVDRRHQVHVADAWIWDDETTRNENALSDESQKFYSIEVPATAAAHLLKNNLTEMALMAIPPLTLTQDKKERPYVEMLL